MRDVAEILVPWAMVTLTLFALLDWDESLLTTEQIERAWPPSTRTLAIVYFGILAVPVHFWRTRRTAQGALVGILAGVLVLGLDWAAVEAIDVLPEDAVCPVMAIIGITFALGLAWLSSRARRRKRSLE
jgi:peptidoglycan/LPS O-acetylase OafA/YrhL